MSDANNTEQRYKWLPPMGSWKFHALLGAVAILILGPLGGVTATYMNFAIGFFVGGQVLAGILGSAITFGYGAEGKHGANYMQTLAASVASMAAMAVLIQAMHWLGFEVPAAWKLVLFYLCIGMFGVGVGMLYTPLLVDKMQLTYPSGLAVANILRALTDKALLKMSIGKLAIGTGIGAVGGAAVEFIGAIGATHFSGATFGAGMIVGARIALPAIMVGLIGEMMIPTLLESGWLADGEPFRKIGFVIALGAILGAAIVDITLVGRDFFKQLKKKADPAVAVVEAPDWKKVSSRRLYAWVLFWAAATFFVATEMFGQNPLHVVVAISLVFVFMIVNGISMGISDSNPISSAFVLTVFVLSGIGLGAATGGLVCASILLISVSIGGDMQQDRSTGWRLGTNRVNQFRYQVIGVSMGAVLAVAFASLFMTANPQLLLDQTEPKNIAAYVENKAVDSVAEARAAVEAGIAPEQFDARRSAWSDAERAAFLASQAKHAVALKAEIAAGTLGPNEKEALETARKIAKRGVDKWQAAMTYKFVGALSVFMDRPLVQGLGNTLSTAEETLFEKSFKNHRAWYPPVPAELVQSPAGVKYAADLKAEAAKAEPGPVAIPADLGTPEMRKTYATSVALAERAHKKSVQTEALIIGISIGLIIELLRKMLRKSARYQAWKKSSKAAATTEFVIDTTILASPYASSFGGFVDLLTSIWFGMGGAFASVSDWLGKRFGKKKPGAVELPEDMSTNSLVGGGLIAGESLFFLVFGIVSLLTSL